MQKAKKLATGFKKAGIRVKFDNNDNNRPGWKFAEYEKKGVPIRIAMGLRDLDNQTVEIVRRDTREKISFPEEGLVPKIEKLLVEIQDAMFQKLCCTVMSILQKPTAGKNLYSCSMKRGDLFLAHWDGTAETEEAIKEQTKATIRCIPLNNPLEKGFCIFSGKPSMQRVLFARAILINASYFLDY